MPADRVERGATEDAVRADRLRGAVGVHADHDRAVEEVGLLGGAVRDEAVFLISIALDGLHEADFRILEMAEDAVEHVWRGLVIRIEHYRDLAGRLLKGVID